MIPPGASWYQGQQGDFTKAYQVRIVIYQAAFSYSAHGFVL